jgi:hypothetical protein
MSKRNQNFSLYAGESPLIFIELDNPDGTPFDPSSSTMHWWAAKTNHEASADVLIKKSLGSGLTVVPSSGVNLKLSATDTVNLAPGYYYHELKLFMPGGDVSLACTGTMVVRGSLPAS